MGYRLSNLSACVKATCLVGCAVAWMAMYSATAMASIEIPDMPGFTDFASRTCATAGEPSHGTDDQPREVERGESFAQALLGLPGQGSSTSTGSSASSSSTSSTLAIGQAFSTLPEIDANVRGWVSGDRKLHLPEPPGSSLLRPPRLDLVV